MAGYKGIEFAKDYDKSFADFKNEFASTHVFKRIPKDRKEAELKKAYKIATDGNPKRSPTESKKSNPSKGK